MYFYKRKFFIQTHLDSTIVELGKLDFVAVLDQREFSREEMVKTLSDLEENPHPYPPPHLEQRRKHREKRRAEVIR
tara:strand:- start:483 stop:710 length:228 start_codon:yes stop_codon:yes gene_type:complete